MKNSISELQSNKMMRSKAEVDAFEKALSDIAQAPDVSILAELFLVFDDHCEHHEVMWGLVHLIESFDLSHVVHNLILSTPLLQQYAPEWTEIVFVRVVNGEETRLLLQKELVALPSERAEQVLSILSKVASRSQKLKERVGPLLEA